MASFMRPQWMGTDRRGGDRIGQEGPSFRCPQRTGTEWIGVERMGEDGPLSCVHNGMEWNGLDWTGRDWTGLDWIGVFFKPREVSDE
jgi:hypothetical protein